ncbi:[histone H3]-trimethyl-L-lysine9/36 demethylase [Entomortierella parvispora]|uniref:[histone H3]-trimethyl-L-lysine(9) demethylase n=1 Tax=Entomortierella parvispora TaxID=205924 RepID=A0A9P3H4M7_9FUNG|nr:[histone H3]-trimethyl-L-lysine9/36 demethylase [Entomortierella parvispora]
MAPLMDIKPDHYYDNVPGGIPVFRPTMEQFKDFSTFCESIVSYGREAGLVKIIPPKEWTAALPDLSERLASVKIKTPIIQHIRGTKGTYYQTNIESRKSYTVAEFKALSEDSMHRPPSRKGVPHGPAEPLPKRKRNRKPVASLQTTTIATDAVPMDTDSLPTTPTRTHHSEADSSDPFSTLAAAAAGRGSPDALVPSSTTVSANHSPDQPSLATLGGPSRRLSLRRPTSPSPPSRRPMTSLDSLVPDTKMDIVAATPTTGSPTVAAGSKPTDTNTSQENHGKTSASKATESQETEVQPVTNYKVEHGEDFTVDYCKEVERNYWRNLTFVQPMYGADMSGSLFDERTTSWNTAHLGDLLSKIDQNLPGVNTPYLYFGMWKATFAWHVEDMDLYSINYLHFGAPKQWYCIRPENSTRFECIAQGIFSTDYKTCPQFLRHKTYLLSPAKLATDGVPVNRLVQHEGEFVLTFPFAYHSGYNLGFNCAESINFALKDWIPIGRKAESCQCIHDSVQIDVEAIFEEAAAAAAAEAAESRPKGGRHQKKSADVEMKEEPIDSNSSISTAATGTKKRRRGGKAQDTESIKSEEAEEDKDEGAVDTKSSTSNRSRSKKAKVVAVVKHDCILCPNQDFKGEMLPTDNGKHCHMICAQYIPETYMSGEDDSEVVVHVDGVPNARRKLRCFVCEKKGGACVQCCKGKCIRAVHASCADDAGLHVEEITQSETGSVEYQVYCPTHDPVQLEAKEAEYKAWKDMMHKKLKPGVRIWARWNNNIYYTGEVETIAEDRMTCRIQFEDGYTKTVLWKDISLDKKQPETGSRTAGYRT